MNEELPTIPAETLSQLADRAVQEGKGKTLFQIQTDVRDAIKLSEPPGCIFVRGGRW